jgi:hypothetical protein
VSFAGECSAADHGLEFTVQQDVGESLTCGVDPRALKNLTNRVSGQMVGSFQG